MDENAIEAQQEGVERALDDVGQFMEQHKETLDEYLAFKRSEGYRDSLPGKLEALMKDFVRSSGYYDVFIPAMKKLSPSYAEYLQRMEAANEKLLIKYPQIGDFNDSNG